MNASDAHLEERLVEHVTGVHFEDLPTAAVDYCKLLIVDSLGVTIPGSQAPGCRQVVDLARTWGGNQGASILIYGYRTPPPLATLANSTMMHALDFDDTLDASALHTFVNVLPAALATAEAVGGIDGRTFIAALVLGVDVICRLSLGIQRPLSWIRTATCGAFGAAATAGKILGLDATQMRDAFGVAYSQTCGNAQGLLEGRLVKRMQPGFAARAGVTAAFLAQRGITGSHQFLQGTYGFYNLYEQGEVAYEPVLADLGSHFTIEDLSIKPYPSCRMTHAAIDAALQVRSSIDAQWQQIDEITVSASQMVTEMVGKPFAIGTNPQVDAQFSIPYTVSAAMIRGDVFLADFEPEAIQEDRVMALAKRVQVRHTSELPAADILRVALAVRLKNGQVQHASTDWPLGNPAKPMGQQQCHAKFRKCIVHSGLNFDAGRVDRLLARVGALESLGDVNDLIGLMQTG